MPYKDLEKRRICSSKSQKNRYYRNLEESRAKNRRYYQKLKSDPIKLKNKRDKAKNYPNSRYTKYKLSAEARNRVFNLTKEEFLQIISLNCSFCGTENAVGIDRKDNEIGYILSNSIPCCSKCNYMKGKLSYTEFINQIRLIYKNLKE